MGIRNAGIIIKEARLKAGLTQEQLSHGICTLNSLSFIENSRYGVSSSTFQALMAKAGSPCEAYPIFKDSKEFDAFICLKNARLYADNWCLSLAYDELIKLKESDYGNNRLYYQEAMYLYCRVMYMTYTADNAHLLDTLYKAISVTYPNFDSGSFGNQYLSSLDFEIINLMANIYINTGDTAKALQICEELDAFLVRTINRDRYYAYLYMLLCFTTSKCHFVNKDATLAKKYSAKARTFSLDYFIYPLKLEIYLLDKINDFMLDKSSLSAEFTYALSVASHLECGFLPRLNAILKEIAVPKDFVPSCNSFKYEFEKFSFNLNLDSMSAGSFDMINADVLTIGSLIGELRKSQALSMRKLCDGLCSVSKLSKIENRSQEPSVYLAEALLNRLGYSERDFLFYGSDKETEYSYAKNDLIARVLRGDVSSPAVDNAIKLCLDSTEPLVKQLGLLFANIKNATSFEERNKLYDSLKITIPNFSLKEFDSYRLSWTEISILNNITVNCILSGDLSEAIRINDRLYDYSKENFIKLGYKNTALISAVKNRLRILYNMGEYRNLINEFFSIEDEFLTKNFNLAGDLLFYSCQSFGELMDYESMKNQARTAAGYFTLMGNTRRCNYLLAEINKDFGVKV